MGKAANATMPRLQQANEGNTSRGRHVAEVFCLPSIGVSMLLLALLSILPHDSAARDTFDTVEVQAVYSWCGREQENGDVEYVLKPTFTQLLFRRWDYDRGEHIIEAWRMAKPNMAYQFSHARNVHEIRWMDGETERIVETKSVVFSSTDVDSEVVERVAYPREWRRDLTKGRK